MSKQSDLKEFYDEMDSLRNNLRKIDINYETEGLQLYQIYLLKKHSETLGRLTRCLLFLTFILVILTATLIIQTFIVSY
jgi:hypothetical protein